jgi:hypothetical protein
MNLGKFVFAQVMEHLPLHPFRRCVVRYSGVSLLKSLSGLGVGLAIATDDF